MWDSTQSAEKFDDRYFAYHPMMWGWDNTNVSFVYWILWTLTWILVLVALIALIRWLWEKGDKEK